MLQQIQLQLVRLGASAIQVSLFEDHTTHETQTHIELDGYDFSVASVGFLRLLESLPECAGCRVVIAALRICALYEEKGDTLESSG